MEICLTTCLGEYKFELKVESAEIIHTTSKRTNTENARVFDALELLTNLVETQLANNVHIQVTY